MNSKQKMLIVDDDEALCESILDIVELEKYSTDISHTAVDCMKKIGSGFYNVILLDMRLPDSDGLTVLEEIKKISPDTEVIIFTAYAQMDTVIEAMEKNAFSFLPKPFEIPYLITIIKKALEKQKIILENRLLYQQTIREEREWEDTFDSISDLVSIHDIDFKIIRCNKAVIEKLNVRYRDVIGKKCHEVFYGSNEIWQKCPFVRCMETLQPESAEEDCMGGTFLMSCYPRFDEDGRFKGVVHIARDITEQKKSERVIQESEKKFRTLVDNIPGVTYRCANDGNWTMQYISDEIEKISGYPTSDFLNNNKRSFDSIIHQDDRSKVIDEVKKGIKNKSPFEMEYRIIDAEKQTHWVFERGIAVLDKNGKALWLDGTIFDITERRQSEKRATSLARILEESLSEIYIFDAATLKFIQASKGARMNLGYSMEEITKLTPLDLKTEFTLESFEQKLEPLRTGKEETIMFQATHRRKDGSLYDVEVHIQSSIFESLPSFAVMALDISDRKKSEKEITRQNTVLNAINSIFKNALTCKTDREVAEMCLSMAEKISDSKFGFYVEINRDGLFDTLALSNPGWDDCVVPITNAMKLIKNMEIRGVDRATMKEENPLIVNDPASHPDKVGVPEGHQPLTSFMGIPLELSGKTIGMIGLANKESGYNHDDQLAIDALAGPFIEVLLNKRAEKSLFNSVQKFRAIFDNTYQFIGMMNPDGTVIDVNRGALDFAGIELSEVFNKPFWETPWWSHSKSLQGLLQRSIQQAAKGEFVRFDATHRKRDGTLAIIDASLNPVKDKDGNVIFIIKECRDITELREREESIRMLSVAIEQSPVIVEVTDSKGNIEYVNPRFSEITGYAKDEVIGKNPRILKSGEKSHEEYIELWLALTSGREWFGEFQNKKKNGELYWESASISPIRDKEGKITHYIGIKEIITRRKKAEETIQHLASFTQLNINPILEIDDSGVIIFNNPAALNVIKKYNIHEGIELFLPKTIKEIMDALKGEERKQFYTEVKIRDLTFGEIIQFVPEFKVFRIYAEDISERKRIEDKLRVSYKMSSLGELTAGVFHEILNPVNIISSHIQLLLLEAEKGSRTEDDLKSVQEEIARIVKITDGLLRFSRTGEYEFNQIDANNLLERTISILEPDMKLSSIRFIREYDNTTPTITGNSDKLRQVFLNLITNARDAMQDGGTLTIKTLLVQRRRLDGLKGHFVEISFADTGSGISIKNQERIFNPFFTTKKEGHGTGLGLSTSYQIIENHGGTISVESNVDNGTIFIIDLPVKI